MSTDPATSGASASNGNHHPDNLTESTLKFWEYTAISAMVLEVFGIFAYGVSTLSIMAFSILFLLALAGSAGGGLLGFIFAVPKYRTESSPGKEFSYNSNLEQVSDWLTKIIIGASLVQINNIIAGIENISLSVAKDVPIPSIATASVTAILYSVFAGFMWGYLWMGVKVRGALDTSSKPANP